MKKGLVLEGGGMRGLFSEGFIDVMQEAGITVDGIIGVSAGALFGCNFKSHQVGRGLRYNVRFKDDPRYMGWRSFITTGNFVNAQFAYHTMPMELDVFDIPWTCSTYLHSKLTRLSSIWRARTSRQANPSISRLTTWRTAPSNGFELLVLCPLPPHLWKSTA